MSDAEFDALFTVDRPVIFAYHGYPWLIHRLTYRRHGHDNLHVRGYKEEGTTTTPFDMVMLNDLDRFHLVMDVIDRVPGLASTAGHVRQLMTDKRISPGRTPASTARTRPRSPAGAGRPENAPSGQRAVARRWSACSTRSRTRSGDSGCSVTETPNGASASRTAFISAAGEAIAPPSPRPLCPPGVRPG